MGRAFAMTVKVLGAGSVSEDSVGILGDTLGDLGQDVDALELLEFLAADLDPVPADPVFQKELAELLWEMVSDGRGVRPHRTSHPTFSSAAARPACPRAWYCHTPRCSTTAGSPLNTRRLSRRT